MSMPLRAGFVGVGAMGGASAARLLERGFAVSVRDVRTAAEAQLAAGGARVARDPATLAASCDVVVTLVVDDAQTEAVVFGPRGLAEALTDAHVLVLSSTLSPECARDVAARLAARGVTVIDAPLSGGPARARSGTLSMMIGGADAGVARALPVLEAMSDRRFRIGPQCGDGCKAKLVNNMLAGVNLAAACEAMALAERLELDARTVFDLVRASSGQSWIFEDRIARVLAGDFAPRAAVTLLAKDLGLAIAAGDAVDADMPVAIAARAIYADAIARGLGGLDDAALIRRYRATGWGTEL
jgi:L-threonate 2-dehydrogenase